MEKALGINEIRTHIGHFLKVNDLKSCALVCRAWSETMIPLIWSTFHWRGRSKGIISSQTMAKHGHHVRKIFIHNFPKNLSPFSLLTQVRELHISDSCNYKPFDNLVILLVQNNRSTLRVFVDNSARGLGETALAVIFGCPLLEQLKLGNLSITAELYPGFTQVCTHLNHLSLLGVSDAADEDLSVSQAVLNLPNLKKMSIFESSATTLVQDLLAHSPNLKSLFLSERQAQQPLLKIETILPYLQQLEALWLDIPLVNKDHCLGTRLIDALPPMKFIQVSCSPYRYDCNPLFEPSLRRHYTALQALVVSDGWTSKQILTALTSCPTLRAIEGGALLAEDVQRDTPWACLNLQFFRVHITSATPDLMERESYFITFHHLSRLIHLILLDLSDTRYGDFPKSSLSLRLGDGLELLEPLKNLQKFAFEEFRVNPGKEEIEWMTRVWPSLRILNGILNEDEGKHTDLREICELSGITTGDLPAKESSLTFVDSFL